MKKKPQNPSPVTMLSYWDKLSKSDIALCHNALAHRDGPGEPGLLPFKTVHTVCDAIRCVIFQKSGKKGVWYRLLYRLDASKHAGLSILSSATNHVVLSPDRIKKLMRHRKMNSDADFTTRVPFLKGPEVRFRRLSKKANLWQFSCDQKHLPAVRAWLEGVTLKPVRG